LDRNHSEWVAHSATPGARVRVIITKAKPKLLLARSQRPVVQLSATDDDTDYYDELPDLYVGYRRPELIDQTADVHNDISDEIKIRLILARKRAMEAYTTKWG
jgi:LmbE family N-acetylglucosaminyl deacetylase